MATGTWNNMDESPKHYAKYDSSDSKSYVLYDIMEKAKLQQHNCQWSEMKRGDYKGA